MGLAKEGRLRMLSDVLGPLYAAATKPILFHSHILPIGENMAALAELGGQGFHSFRGCAAALDALDRHAAFLERWRARTPDTPAGASRLAAQRSEEHTSELQSLMRISYAVFCLKKTTKNNNAINKNYT